MKIDPTVPLFSPFSAGNILASGLACVSACLAAGGGIGGGGLFIPLYVLAVGYKPSDAISLSVATIFGGQIANLIINLMKKHPTAKNRPLIDFKAALLMEPSALVGTIFGVLLNKIFPFWLITGLLVLLLLFSTYKTVQKGRKLWRKESMASLNGSLQEPLSGSIQGGRPQTKSEKAPLNPSATLERILVADARPVDTRTMCILLLVWLVVSLVGLFIRVRPNLRSTAYTIPT
jgi:hypothetical protein